MRQAVASVEGSWSGPICWPTVAVHVIQLHTGKILTWPNNSGSPDFIETWLWDPAPHCFDDNPRSNPDPSCFRRVDNHETNLFCAGHAALADGRILTIGGHAPAIGNHNGLNDANIFDPDTEVWLGEAAGVGQMAFRRWYPTATTLGDGRVFNVAGTNRKCFGGANDGHECHSNVECPGGLCTADESVDVIATPEVFDPTTSSFTALAAAGAQLSLPIYAEMFLLPDGRVFFAGAEGAGGGIDIGAFDNRAFDPTTETWSFVDTSTVPGASAAMYEPGKVLKVGGNTGVSLTATAGAEVIDLTSTGSAQWRSVPSMAAGRLFSNLTLLPDGTVMVSGGTRDVFNREYNFFCDGGDRNGAECSPAGFPPGDPGMSATCPGSSAAFVGCPGGGNCVGDGAQFWVSEVEIFDPVTETWAQMAHSGTPRQYHSATVLLPDGRVVSSGGGQGGGAIHDYSTVEIFSPPYLFKGPRPTVTSAPLAVDYGQSFDVATPDAGEIAKASLIRLAVTTHGTDQNARFVPLSFESQAGSVRITGAKVGGVDVPLNGNVAPPGYYLLFLVNDAGVPSIGRYVRLGDGPLAQCRDVSTTTDPGSCSAADVSVDDGSFDPGGTAVTLDQVPPGPYGLGSTTVTLTATDGGGLESKCTATVTVTDDEGPVFSSVPADVTTTSCSAPNLGQAIAADNCGGTVTVTNDAPAKFQLGTTIVTWTAADARGNVRTATQRVTALLGDDPSCCPAGTNIVLGTSNNDTLNGTSGADCILGRGAQDTINAGTGNDFVSGGDGNDNISGGAGNDVVFAGSGQDVVNGNDGSDTLHGGDGDDGITGGIGDDRLSGGQGQDTLQGQDGNDQLFGDTGDDNLQGGNGNDDLAGGANNDTCNGGSGANTFARCEFGAPNSCADGVLNGTETGLDCGGGCRGCGMAGACVSGGDCLSAVCSVGSCQDLPGGLAASAVVETDWGGGYCVHLDVTNVSDAPTVGWTVTLDTNQSTIFTSWNGTFSGSSGAISVAPNANGHPVVAPSQTVASTGFCANRTASGSGLLPFTTSATASF